MVALQLFLGLFLCLCSCFGTHLIAERANRLFSILCTWPSHLNRILLKIFHILPIPVLCLTSSFVILYFQVIHKILLNHLWCAASNFLLFVTVTNHVSLPYFRVTYASDSYRPNLIFTFSLSLLLFQTFESLPKVALAFQILILISVSPIDNCCLLMHTTKVTELIDTLYFSTFSLDCVDFFAFKNNNLHQLCFPSAYVETNFNPLDLLRLQFV